MYNKNKEHSQKQIPAIGGWITAEEDSFVPTACVLAAFYCAARLGAMRSQDLKRKIGIFSKKALAKNFLNESKSEEKQVKEFLPHTQSI